MNYCRARCNFSSGCFLPATPFPHHRRVHPQDRDKLKQLAPPPQMDLFG
jgi:hypothetical protein